MKNEFQTLHNKALEIVKNYFQAESDLIEILQKIDQTRAYYELGYKSLFVYATEALRLPENVAYNLITLSRKSTEIPELKEMIQKQEISVSNARLITPILTPENQGKWLYAASTLSKRELEREIAREFPEQLTPERVRYITGDRLELKIGISDELRQKLSRAQDLVSQKLGKHASLEEVIAIMAESYLEKEDPIRKAARAQIKPQTQPMPQTSSRYLPAPIKHQVVLRDQTQCTYRDPTGKRCQDQRWIDYHHIKPLSHGGDHKLENLTTLCRGHHRMLHALVT